VTEPRRPVVNVHEAEGFPMAPEGGSATFGATVAPLGARIGAEKLGAMLTTVEPGRRAFPFHAHHANEEMFLVLEGAGAIRIGDATHPIRAGDLIACRAGGPETAHQIVNTGTATLKYLGISTMIDPDVTEYPDSGKHGVLSIGAGRDFFSARVKHIFRASEGLDYWEGEP
jgi:uncharacterized cupin superfamily protein